MGPCCAEAFHSGPVNRLARLARGLCHEVRREGVDRGDRSAPHERRDARPGLRAPSCSKTAYCTAPSASSEPAQKFNGPCGLTARCAMDQIWSQRGLHGLRADPSRPKPNPADS